MNAFCSLEVCSKNFFTTKAGAMLCEDDAMHDDVSLRVSQAYDVSLRPIIYVYYYVRSPLNVRFVSFGCGPGPKYYLKYCTRLLANEC
jgi:hypothetical protein